MKIKEYIYSLLKNHSLFYFLLVVFIGILLGVVLSISILPMITSFAVFQKMKPFEYDPVSMLSINVGLLQGLIGIMTIGIALIGVNTFKSLKDNMNSLKEDVIKLKNNNNSAIDDENSKPIKNGNSVHEKIKFTNEGNSSIEEITANVGGNDDIN